MTIQVTIGDDTVKYHIRETHAPADFDGFGTFTVAEYSYKDKLTRFVLIRDEQLGWQESRYSSGNCASSVPESFDARDVATVLWARLQGRQP